MLFVEKLYSLYLRHFFGNKTDRPIYQEIYNARVRKIVELELDDCQRAIRMIEIAKTASPNTTIHYVALDRFEDRDERYAEVVLTLKGAYRLFKTTGALVQLLPGNPPEVLPKAANFLGKTDLLLLPEEPASEAWGRMWFFVPRLLHPQTLVFVKRKTPDGKTIFTRKTHAEIEQLAYGGTKHRAA